MSFTVPQPNNNLSIVVNRPQTINTIQSPMKNMCPDLYGL